MMRAAPFALLALCAAILFSGHETLGFIDEREARDAVVGYELLARREVLTPVLAGEPRFEKPLLAYSTEAIGALITWRSPFGPRLLKAACAVALVLLTASVAARHFGARAGWCSAFVLVTTFGMPLAVRTDGAQVLATLLAWAGVQGFADSLFGRRAGLDPRLLVGWGGIAAAFVVGGPLPALWPLAALALYARLARVGDAWRRVHPLAGLALVAGVALPWYGAMIERHGVTFITHALFFPYAGTPHVAWYAGPFRALASLVVAAFPWSTLLPGAALHAAIAWRARRRAGVVGRAGTAAAMEQDRRDESAAHFFVACIAAALVPVALYPTPPLPAVLPALPAVAILCGRLLDHVIEDETREDGHVGWATRMLAVVGAAGAILLSLVATRVPGPASPELRALAALVLVSSCAPFLAGFMGRRRIAALLVAAPVSLGAPWVTERLLPKMEDYLNTRAAAAAMESVAPPRAALVVEGETPPSLRFYSPRNLVERWPLEQALEEFRASDGLAYVVFRPSHERVVARAARGPLEIVLRSPTLVLARVHPG